MYQALIYLTIFVLSTCGLVYQLLAGAAASYLLGDSITQFSLVIGTFLSALGLGAYVSRYVEGPPARSFVDASYAAAIVGGLTTELLFLAFPRSGFFKPLLYGCVLAVGTLVGVQLPLLLRVLRRQTGVKELASRALAVDYAGAVMGSLLFSMVLVPKLGLARTGLLFGMCNALAALAATWVLAAEVGPPFALRVKGVLTVASLGFLLLYAGRMDAHVEDGMYPDPVVFARSSPYQRLVFTSGRGSLQLFLDGNLQFASADEHRYHEALVHPAFSVARAHGRVLVLGGGDGLAVREILRYRDVEHVTLVDLDPVITNLAQNMERLVQLNGGSLRSSRVTVLNHDAMVWLAENDRLFDVVVVDFPDPNNYSLGKLYTTRFYTLLRRHLAPGAAVVVQSTSPLQARQSFWIIARTMEAAGFRVRPYHVAVPSFGEWGYVLASTSEFSVPSRTLSGLRYLTDELLPTLFVFPADMAPLQAPINRLNNQVLVPTYEREWRRYN